MAILSGDGASTALRIIFFYCIFEAQKFVLSVKLDKLYGTVTLPCENAEKWYNPYGELILPVEADKKYSITDGNLTVYKVGEFDLGKYFCTVGGINDSVEVHSQPIVKPLDKSYNIVQGNEVRVECHALGYPVPDYAWYRILDGENVNMSAGSTLYINEATKEDYGNYMCQATNVHGIGNWTTKLRIKDKLAPLWPFIGILIEVIVLVVIIIIYEKRKSKQDAEENSKENIQKSNDNNSSNVRQRK